MREQETDLYDGNDPGVTISFVGLSSTIFTTCLNDATTANRYALLQCLDKVTGPGSYEDDENITSYFASTASDGAYLIADEFISYIINRSSNNIIIAPDNLIAIFEELENVDEQLSNDLLDADTRSMLLQRQAFLQRIPEALDTINNVAGKAIFSFDDYTLTIQNSSNPTIYEKQAVLACFTANVTFNSFAAEVEFHADAVNSWQSNIPIVGNIWYEAAVRADMAVGEEVESGYYDDYYDLEGSLVKAQINAHGEY